MFFQFLLFTPTSWFLASLLGIGLLVFAKGGMGRPRGFASWTLMTFLILFWVSFLFRMQPYGYEELVAFTVGPLGYYVLTHATWTRNILAWREMIAWTFAGTGTLIGLHGLIVFPVQALPRLSGLFHGVEPYMIFPNTLAALLLLVMPFGVYLILTRHEKWQRLATGAMLAVNATALFLTFSRGALLALSATVLLIGFGVVIGVFAKRFPGKMVLMRSATLIILFSLSAGLALGLNALRRDFQDPELARLIPVTEDVTDRLSDREAGADQSTDERIQFWRGSLRLIDYYPFAGVGSDGFRFQYPRVQTEPLAISSHPHNLFLKLAVENGILAALAFAVFLFTLLTTFLKRAFIWLIKRKTPPPSFEQIVFDVVLLVAFLAANLHLMTDYNINATIVWGAYWAVLILMGMRVAEEKIFPVSRCSTIVTSIVLVLFLGGSVLSYGSYRATKMVLEKVRTGEEADLTGFLERAHVFPFLPLVYEESGRLARDGKLTTAQINVLLPLFERVGARFSAWPSLTAAKGRLLSANWKFNEASKAYEQALAADKWNEFEWHLEYLQSLLQAGDVSAVGDKSAEYFTIMRAYQMKLSLNAHNTVAKENPRAVAGIIAVYRSLLPNDPQWKDIEETYTTVWQREREKFQLLFPEVVLRM